MGGDHGPRVTVAAAVRILRQYPNVNVILVGFENKLLPMLKRRASGLEGRWRVVNCTELVSMDEPPAQALRYKKDSSMRVAINLVKQGEANACVSAGNTGALMATARFVLKTLPGIDRPAIITRLPTRTSKVVRVLDLGANVNSTAEHLYQFAVMGAALVELVEARERPVVALLNIGQEDIKGNEQVRQAAVLLSQNSFINYTGFIEGNNVFNGDVDVVVCDGFVGNVMLKSIEGLAKLVAFNVRRVFTANIFTKLGAFIVRPILNKLKNILDPRLQNGATLIGLKGIVIKSHGGADVLSYTKAIEEAILECEKNVPEQIRRKVALVLGEENHH